MSTKPPEISTARLQTLLEGINSFGYNPESGGYNRIGFSESDMAVRAWFTEQMRGDGLGVRRDAVGNVIGRFGPADGPCVMAGSHLDTVPEGGPFDGSLGTAVALESVRAMKSAGIEPAIAVEVVATAEEEGRFGGMLGSQAIVGKATAEWIENASDADGVRLVDAMQEKGFNPADAASARRDPADVKAFLELHIEQGPVLERSGTAIGIAEAVSGVCNLAVRYSGEANHSGTTPMEGRRDAFAGMASLGASIADIIGVHGTERSRVTIGKLDIYPNFPHTIPGDAECVVNIRDTDRDVMIALAGAVRDAAANAAQVNGLSFEIEQKSWLDPVELDAGLVALMLRKAEKLGLNCRVMPSGAGHDAQTMQALCPSALIFVPSRNGISHSPKEWTDWADIEKGANLYLATLIELSS